MDRSRFVNAFFLTSLVLIIAFFSFSYIFNKEKSFSEDENRLLRRFPVADADDILDGTYSARLHNYFSDQIALRTELVELKARVELALGKEENNGVLLGEDGYLIEAHYYTDDNYEHLESNLSSLELLKERLESHEIRVISAIVPRKIDVLHDSLPALFPTIQSERAWKYVTERHIDLRPALSVRDVFYKTDHHLTAKGAAAVYRTLGDALGYIPRHADSIRHTTLSEDFFGTSFSRSGFFFAEPDVLHAPELPQGRYTTEILDTGERFDGLYDLSYLNKKDKYSAFLGGNHAQVRISQDHTDSEAERPSLLIVRDSFAHALAPYLVEHFDLILIDPRYFNDSIEKYIIENDIENVLFLFGLDTLATAELEIR